MNPSTETMQMPDLTTLEQFDADGALRETAEDSRGSFMRQAGLVGAGLAGGGLLLAARAPSASAATKRDVSILNFALTLEYLEAAFYAEALKKRRLKGATLTFARIVAAHERTHVEFLKGALGSAAIKRPKFDFKDSTSSQKAFQQTAIVLEDTGVKAYAGQAVRIDTAAILTAAVTIHSIEARHASWIRQIVGQKPAPNAFDPPLTRAQVLDAVGKTGFIVG